MATSTPSSVEETNEDAKRKRKIKFLPLPSTPKLDFSVRQGGKWSPRHGFRIRKSLWMWIAIGVLFVANILYAVAFLTNRWGVLLVNPDQPVRNGIRNNAFGISGLQHNNITNTSNRNSPGLPKPNSDTRNRHQKLLYNQNNGGRLSVSELFNVSTHSSSSQSGATLETSEKYWEFGLWECCRNDGFCLGTRWPGEVYVIHSPPTVT